MTQKFKLFFILFAFSLVFFFGIVAIGKVFFPEKTRVFLNKTIFLVPYINKKINNNNIKIRQLEKKNLELADKIDNLTILSNGSTSLLETKKIKSEKNIYEINTYKLPFLGQPPGQKPGAYLAQTEDKVVVVSGKGEFFSFKKEELGLNNINIKKINSNIKSLILENDFYADRSSSIKDLLILNNKIYFSYSDKQSQECYNTSIISSDLNFEKLEFSKFFSSDECIPDKRNKINTLHVGGKMLPFKNEKILLTIGDNHVRSTPQKKNSMYGKIISIDIKSKETEIVAMGVRNSQGLYYDQNSDIILFTDHGPKGGDEININFSPDNEIIENYGWPISSYGEEYDGKTREGSPFYKSHIDYGFIEPLKYFTDSIGIGAIIKVPNIFNKGYTNGFFIGALGYKHQMDEGDQSLHHINLDKDMKKIVYEDVIPIGERIRDLILIEKNNEVLMVLESVPAISVLKLAN